MPEADNQATSAEALATDVLPAESAVYTGHVRHRRYAPKRHEFTYRIALAMVRLDEIDEFVDRHPLYARRKGFPVQFRRRDYMGDESVPLDECVRDLVEERTGRRPIGPITMLAHLRTFGWCFNPLTAFYCYDEAGTAIETQVIEVTNTPWGERHAYVADGATSTPGTGRSWTASFDKELHVSPFMPMDQTYRLRSNAPGPGLHLGLQNVQDDEVVFDADLVLRRRPATAIELTKVLWQYPFMTLRVSVGIHWQALKLALRRIPFVPHPDKETSS